MLKRIVYQVGRPWIFDGHRFFPETGIPILNRARRMVLLAVAEPEPLTVQKVIPNSFTIGPPIDGGRSSCAVGIICDIRSPCGLSKGWKWDRVNKNR